MGFDGSVCNEHHNNVISMQESVNVSAAVLTQRIKGTIALIGNPLPIHDNPVRVAEEIAMLDLISGGRIISGFVRGTGVEQLSANANPAYNRERFEEAFQLIKKAWTVPGPFRWEGKHYHLRVVNPWQLPLQKPHPPIWAAGILSPETIRWAAKQRITYLVLGSALEGTAMCRDIYHEVARQDGWTPGPEHLGYLIHTCVMDTDEEAFEVGRHHYGMSTGIGKGGIGTSAVTQGTGSAGVTSGGPHPEWYAPPGYMSKQAKTSTIAKERRVTEGSYEDANRVGLVVTGSPKTIIQKFKHIIDRTDPGYLTFWAREGKKTHQATMRGIELLGKEVIPELREHQSALVTGKEVTPWPH
jgi:alkanesulfonate monooxygenase SsuD/methylene tetrahydromethanopterin reductase-like flavin-dependent oxidoreductase (luciferase family)